MYARKFIYKIGPVSYNKEFDIDGYSYKSYDFYSPYYYPAGLYYDENGKKYYKTPLTPIIKNSVENPMMPENQNSSGVKATIKYF